MVSNERVCPRCGEPYSYLKRKRVGGKIYLYAVHYLGYSRDSSGRVRKHTRECYLGPEGSYEHVTLTHSREGLILKGMADPDRALAYLDALISYLSGARLDRGLALKLADRFEVLARRLREAAREHS